MTHSLRCWALPLLLCWLPAAAVGAAPVAPVAPDYCRQAASDSSPNARLYAAAECALAGRRYRDAIKAFGELVGSDPNPIFRAELGRAYLGAQEYERAREQFLIALQSNPPEPARKLLRIFIRMADQNRTQAKDWFAQAAIGEMYDSNVNSGPVSAGVTLFGLPFTMNPDSMPKSDRALHAAFSVVRNKSLGGLASWQSDASLDVTKYATYGNYDSQQLGIDSGAHLAMPGGRAELYLPFAVTRTTLGGSGYSATASFSPQASVRLDRADLLLASLSIARNRYDAAPARDTSAAVLGLSWRRVLGESWTIDPSLKFGSERGRDSAFSNLARSAGLSLSGSLPHGLRLSAASTYTWADYRAAEVWAGAPRKDRRRNSSLSLAKELDGGYYATLSWLDISTRSNLGLYSTARRQIQLQISKAF